MSLVDWALANPKPALTAAGGLATAICGASVYASDLTEHPSQYIFRYVPEQQRPGNQDWSEVMDGLEFKDAPLVEHPYAKIIAGDRSYNGGNYVVYYGPEACPHCTKFMFNDPNLASGRLEVKQDKMSHGTWMKAFAFTRENQELKKKNIRFIMFEDIPDKEKAREDERQWTLPWARWQFDDLAKGIRKGDLIRRDKSARDILEIMRVSQREFGDKVPGTPTVIVYKEGKPKVFNKDSFQELQQAQQDESMADETLLNAFIRYYYSLK